MDNYIIKASGNINDVITALKTIESIAGKGATLSDVVTVARFARIQKTVKKQFERGIEN